jgi:hypothetical protein
MKPVKRYFSRIAILFIALGSMAILLCLGFYKNFDAEIIPQNTDGIVMIDVKNIRNHGIVTYLKSPSHWSFFSNEKKKKTFIDFSEYKIKTPDYLAIFHLENQPISQWHSVAKLENENEFEKAILKKHFKKEKFKNGMPSYFSKSLGIYIIKHSNQILISKIDDTQKAIAVKTAEELFLKKHFLDDNTIQNIMDTPNAITVWIKKNTFLEKDAIVNVNLKGQDIIAAGLLKLNSKYKKTTLFTQNPSAVLSVGLDFEMIRSQTTFKNHLAQINKLLGIDMDSIMVHHPSKTELIFNEMVEKSHSAISYDYDDDFNPIKKVVVRTSREPSFYFSVQTENSQKIYTYLKTKNAIDNRSLFVNFPLAPTQTSVKNNTLIFEANPPKTRKLKPLLSKIGYIRMNFNKLQPQDWRFIIGRNKNLELLKSFKTFEMDLNLEKNTGHFVAHLTSK